MKQTQSKLKPTTNYYHSSSFFINIINNNYSNSSINSSSMFIVFGHSYNGDWIKTVQVQSHFDHKMAAVDHILNEIWLNAAVLIAAVGEEEEKKKQKCHMTTVNPEDFVNERSFESKTSKRSAWNLLNYGEIRRKTATYLMWGTWRRTSRTRTGCPVCPRSCWTSRCGTSPYPVIKLV